MAQKYVGMFAIDDRPFCVWDADFVARNRECLSMLDPDYFHHIATQNLEYLKNSSIDAKRARQYAAMNLRLTYSHALETFFALIGATVQAPDCVVGWLHLYRVDALTNLIRKISSGSDYYSEFEPTPTGWDGVARLVFGPAKNADPRKHQFLVENFSRLWRSFAADFTNAKLSDEYNAVKHGLRFQSGGSRFAMSLQNTGDQTGKSVMEIESEFGTRHFHVELMKDKSRNYMLQQRHRNWNPIGFYYGIDLLARSIANVLGFLKAINGMGDETQDVSYPTDPEYYLKPWKDLPDILNLQFNSTIDAANTEILSSDAILARYNSLDPPSESST